MLIFVADSSPDMQLGLHMYLQKEVGMYVVGIAVQAKGLVAQVEASEAEVLILDWNLKGASIADLITDVRLLAAPPKIIVLAVRPETQEEAFDAGADAFVSMSKSPGELVKLLRSHQDEKV